MIDTRDLWAILHTGDGSTDLLREVRAALPCPACVHHFDEYIRLVPPVFGAGWFAWTVAFHNAVNARLGKPTFTVEEAARMWKPSMSTWHPLVLHV